MNESNKNISITRSYLKSKILNDSTLIGYENETNQIQKLIERTIENGESNSVLLIGPRCSGKTTLLRNVLNNLNKKKLLRTNSVFVELHGLVHTDDRLALKEMTSQMDLDNAVDGKVFGSFAAGTIKDFEDKLAEFEKDEILEMLNDVTVLELCLLIAMKHHCDIYDNQLMNFEMIYTRYVKFVNANSNIQTVQRAVVMKAFEHIQNMELIVSVSQGTKLQKEYQMFKLLLSPQQILEFVKKSSASIPTEVVQWANSSIV
nr:origin recognition complex subunit 4-like [Onthophagus taurus]